MKISGQLLKKIILEEVTKVLEKSKDAEKVAQSVEKATGFESKIKAINTQEELEELLQFVMSKLDPKKINATRAKRALKTIFSKL
tara:strand:- start:278 stop:532 length:255 start_codon:yes stop_codon:yes gene_type:complete